MGRISEYSGEELAALFPTRKPEDRKPEPTAPLPGWTEEGVERMLRDIYGLDEGGGEGAKG